MKKSLLVLVGLVLLLPTVYCAAAGAQARSGGGLMLGVWMFIGLPTMVGAIFAFTKANKLFQEEGQEARLSGKTYPPVDHPAVAETAEPPSDAKVKMMAAMEHAIQTMPKKPTGSAFGKRSS